MKKGITLNELAAEIFRQKKVMEDYIVESSKLYMDAENGSPLIRIFDGEGNDRILPLGIGVYAHRQLASYLSIPQNYYNLMLEEKPELLSVNVNEWLAGSKDRRNAAHT